MLNGTEDIGLDWLVDEIDEIVESIDHMTPSEFNEMYRYLPNSVSDSPGPFSFSLTPFLREIVNCADPRSPILEVNVKKGVQIGYTTMLECVLLYYIVFIKTRPAMLISADKELVKGRIENCILPMLEQSGFSHLIQSSDEGNSRKTGKTANHLQWEGGGFLIPGGANNADKMRMWSILLMLKDELDAWAITVGKDGCPDKLTDARCDTFKDTKKIYRGGTPLIKGSSKITSRFEEGDQRIYKVPCKHCGFKQNLRWTRINKETGEVTGFVWNYDEDGIVDLESVRYLCEKCGGEHFEHDKTWMFAEENGAEWVPTAKPVNRGVRSYHLPAFYSPYGFRPWSQCVTEYLDAYDDINRQVKDIGKYQVFYNNVLAEPFEVLGDKIRFKSVSAHRRSVYRLGQIPNKFAEQWSGSRILFLTCQVDVHKSNLAVSVKGWTKDSKPYLIDYWRFEVEDGQDDCTELSSPVWQRVRDLIEEKVYEADDGQQYRINTTFIDAGYANDTVSTFCSDYSGGVFPILGRDRPGKNQSIMEFGEFTTQAGTIGYKITVDHYKDRMAPVLRREWHEGDGEQKIYHFNAPVDITDKQLMELTRESRREKVDDKGVVTHYWHRPQGAANELFDLLGYGYAAVEVIAWSICVQHFELDTIDWHKFWEFVAMPENDALFGRVAKIKQT